MKRLVVALLAFLLFASWAGAGAIVHTENPVPGSFIVVVKPDAARSQLFPNAPGPDLRSLAEEMALVQQGQVVAVYGAALHGFAIRLTPEAAARLSTDPRVQRIEEDGYVHLVTTQSNATWGLDRIDQRDLPLSGTYTYTTTGSGVNAYIIDTGIRSTHQEFTGRVGNGYSSISDGGGTNDCNGHGTHVSGTVGGTTYGVAKQVTLHPVRVLDCSGSGTVSGVVAGIDWVTSNAVKPAVANMSLGGSASTSLDDAVRNSINSGVVYAVAAGNDSADACNTSPARVSEALTVGATTSSDARSSFSNYGTCLDLFAPGSSITSSWYSSDTATNTIDGTSMASPHVAGTAALYLQSNPSATPSAVASAIINNATSGKVTNAGSGSPNRLLYMVFGGGPVDNPPVARFTYSCTGLACNFDGSGSTDDNGITNYAWDYGDGGTGSGVQTTHSYGASGTFNVKLTVTDTINQTGNQTQAVTVSSGGGSDPCTGCEHFTGSLSGSGAYQYQPNGQSYNAIKGTHEGWLRGPAGTDYDLYLLKYSSFWGWYTVARSEGSTSEEHIVYKGTAGYYVWKVVSYSGSGAYDFWMKRP